MSVSSFLSVDIDSNTESTTGLKVTPRRKTLLLVEKRAISLHPLLHGAEAVWLQHAGPRVNRKIRHRLSRRADTSSFLNAMIGLGGVLCSTDLGFPSSLPQSSAHTSPPSCLLLFRLLLLSARVLEGCMNQQKPACIFFSLLLLLKLSLHWKLMCVYWDGISDPGSHRSSFTLTPFSTFVIIHSIYTNHYRISMSVIYKTQWDSLC